MGLRGSHEGGVPGAEGAGPRSSDPEDEPERSLLCKQEDRPVRTHPRKWLQQMPNLLAPWSGDPIHPKCEKQTSAVKAMQPAALHHSSRANEMLFPSFHSLYILFPFFPPCSALHLIDQIYFWSESSVFKKTSLVVTHNLLRAVFLLFSIIFEVHRLLQVSLFISLLSLSSIPLPFLIHQIWIIIHSFWVLCHLNNKLYRVNYSSFQTRIFKDGLWIVNLLQSCLPHIICILHSFKWLNWIQRSFLSTTEDIQASTAVSPPWFSCTADLFFLETLTVCLYGLKFCSNVYRCEFFLLYAVSFLRC